MGLFDGTTLERPVRCERCGNLEAECTCLPPAKEWKAPGKQTARVAIEKRKQGRFVTVVRGLSPDESDLPALLGRLKSACGAGGTHKDGLLEIQGQHLQSVRELLQQIGYRIR